MKDDVRGSSIFPNHTNNEKERYATEISRHGGLGCAPGCM